MDVRCERCDTEYEFDDALVSGRGTTVKCTNCGHKFKIRRKDGDFSEDFWNVQTGDGRTLVFTSLRELQRAIQTNLVDRNDLLSRGGLKQKPIGGIPELAPFFEQRDQRKSLPPPAVAEAASPTRPSRPPPPPGIATAPLAPPRQRMSTRPDFPPAPGERSDRPPSPASLSSMKKTLAGTGEASGVPSSVEPLPAAPALRERLGALRPSEAPPSTEREPEPDTERFAREQREAPNASRAALTKTQPIHPPPASGHVVAAQPAPPREVLEFPKHSPAPPAFEASSPLPPPTAPVLRTMHVDDEYSDAVRGRPALSDNPPSMGRRRSVGGFIVAIVVIAGVALIGAVWARDHLGGVLGGRPPPAPTSDPRVAGFLVAGEKALTDGNLDAAKESFDKASALSEKDPRVLLDLARFATVRADVPWLKARLLPADATDDVRLTKDSLAELSAAARKAADDALAVAPEDPAVLRTKIDALRIAGDRDGARALVPRVGGAGSSDTAYVLAALDLADNEPLWSTVVERLRVAAKDESGPGRARAALVYALARSGDVAGAKAEIERLVGMTRQHPLMPLLRAFADHAKPIAKNDPPAVDAGPVATVTDAGKPEKGEKPEKGGRGLPSDGRQLVVQGEAARGRGDLDRAQMLFAAALDRNPNDTEALNGLASIAHSRHDLNGARASYKRVLSINPSYVPALVGLGDVEWESGDRASAMKTYKEIVDRFPEGTYPSRVKSRVEGAAGSSGAQPAPTPTPSESGGGG